MGRWTQYDDDDYRLPAGMKRVGYDADTQRYTFQQGDELWLGEPGAEYGGHLTRAETATGNRPDDDAELESGSMPLGRSDGYQPLAPENGVRPVYSNKNSYRPFMPFMLLIGVFLLFIWRFVVGHSAPIPPSQERMCVGGPNATKHHVREGDSCWKIAHTHGTNVNSLLNETLNPGLECDHLKPGDVLCMPDET